MSKIDLYTLLNLVGGLSDSDEPGSASERFRKYLHDNVKQAQDLREYVEIALTESGDQFNKSLQDLINHLGQLLGFDVVYGRYRGTREEIGFDGLWHSSTDWSIVVETKTTDVYLVKTAPLLGYINQRSQRRSFNWQGFQELLKHFRVEQPRIVGRPKTRIAASLVWAGLRKRVFLKSPVQPVRRTGEDRTPGSVRGLLGNWQSYRDGRIATSQISLLKRQGGSSKSSFPGR
jgi:hypothetical protein